MSLSHSAHALLDAEMQSLKSRGVAFAMATVVRTVDATSAKPGGKALLDTDGKILMGWVGGGCARSAVAAAAREAIATGETRFISLRPQDLLEDAGISPGAVQDGVRFARNGCPSRGTMDIFIEPVLPLPEMVICGTGMVAMALADLARRFDFNVRLFGAMASGPDQEATSGFEFETSDFVVVATQGQGDADALRCAVRSSAAYIGFVGSTRKFQTLTGRLVDHEPDLANALARVQAPAGLAINAITPDEIALSILAQVTQLRRERGQTRL